MDLSEEVEERHQNPFLSRNKTKAPKLQFRNEVSRARWDEDMRMGEIVEKKGGIWGNTGIIRNGGRLYCFIEEILYLAERGALVLFCEKDTILTFNDILKMVADGKNGCCWEAYTAYRRLKSLGYIVGRYGVTWTSRSNKSCPSNSGSESELLISEERSDDTKYAKSVAEFFQDIQINDMKPIFNVYLPDSKFRKTSPEDPIFSLCLIRGKPPSEAEIEMLKEKNNAIPVKLCHVDHWLVSFFSFERVYLPVLP